jgi:primosomal protein N' (replication factor Y)
VDQFYRQEMAFRRDLGYPPCARMIQVRFSGRSATATAQVAGKAGELARRFAQAQEPPGDLMVLGPIEAPVARIKDRFRWQLLLKGRRSAVLHAMAKAVMAALEGRGSDRQVRIRVDVDPLKMM